MLGRPTRPFIRYLRAVRFGPWHPLESALDAAPDEPGVLQARAEVLLDFPSGRSAMVLYAATPPDEALRTSVGGRLSTALARAAELGARYVRFGQSPAPDSDLLRLLRDFEERFGAPPPGNAAPTGVNDDHG